MNAITRQGPIHPDLFNKTLMRQLSPIFSMFDNDSLVITTIDDNHIGYAIDDEIATVTFWGLKRLYRLIALVATVSAYHNPTIPFNPRDVIIPSPIPNEVFTYLHLERPAIIDGIKPNHSNPLRVVHSTEDALKSSWNHYTRMGQDAVQWIEQAYARCYNSNATADLVSRLEAMDIDDNSALTIRGSNYTNAVLGDPAYPATPPPSPVSLGGSNSYSSHHAMVVHPTHSTYASNNPGFNPFLNSGTIVRDVNA
ncbi:hypothetical protein CVT24_006837 [Panaeolus cyanescens]|uniref:Uncharacterized protein n=1 Tax=Panaeolus cyanescens TaxID=181874 RepID=A0A409X154_9AGAR|nr:hypothetical protein CVT24_006837 [Panaeolus cyanescens]